MLRLHPFAPPYNNVFKVKIVKDLVGRGHDLTKELSQKLPGRIKLIKRYCYSGLKSVEIIHIRVFASAINLSPRFLVGKEGTRSLNKNRIIYSVRLYSNNPVTYICNYRRGLDW
jgi:hypothetical protein